MGFSSVESNPAKVMMVSWMAQGVGAQSDSIFNSNPTMDDLMDAIRNNDTSTARVLVGKITDINTLNDDGQTALHTVVSNGNMDLVKILLKKTNDINIADKGGNDSITLCGLSW